VFVFFAQCKVIALCHCLAVFLFRFACPGLSARRHFGSQKFPSPLCTHMIRSKTPVVSRMLAFIAFKTAAFRSNQTVGFGSLCFASLLSTTIHISGLYTDPARLFHPASDARYRVCLWTSLPTCWLGFDRVGMRPSFRSAPTRLQHRVS